VLLLSQSLWARSFAADPRILGRKVRIEDRACSVVGVMPAAFRFPSQSEVWAPVGPVASRDDRVGRFDSVIGRLRPGVTLAVARQDMAGVAQALARQYPLSNEGVGARVVPLRDVWVGDIKQSLLLLLGACSFLLLMTCANVANLLLSFALGREREIAIRTALGADRRRLVKQLAAEHLVFAACGGVLGLVFAYLGVVAVGSALPIVLPSWLELGVDWRAVGYTACISALVGVIFGLAPMLQLARTDLTSSLKEGAAAGGDRSRRLLRSSLVVIEIALALVLLAGARLMVTSFLRLRQVDPGFRSAGVLVADVNLTYRAGEVSARGRFSQLMQAALARVAQIPGVESAAADGTLPLADQEVWERTVVTLFGQSPDAQRQNPVVNWQAVSPDYFKTLGIGLVRGRVPYGPPLAISVEPRAARAVALAFDDAKSAPALGALELALQPPAFEAQPGLAQAAAEAAVADVQVGQPHRGADAEEAAEVGGLQVADEGEHDLERQEVARLDRQHEEQQDGRPAVGGREGGDQDGEQHALALQQREPGRRRHRAGGAFLQRLHAQGEAAGQHRGRQHQPPEMLPSQAGIGVAAEHVQDQ
jgi:hypothetical protein